MFNRSTSRPRPLIPVTPTCPFPSAAVSHPPPRRCPLAVSGKFLCCLETAQSCISLEQKHAAPLRQHFNSSRPGLAVHIIVGPSRALIHFDLTVFNADLSLTLLTCSLFLVICEMNGFADSVFPDSKETQCKFI